ncbi:CPBP family glutamic-type intramembrane protease [Pelagerythrobacter aerophilus]
MTSQHIDSPSAIKPTLPTGLTRAIVEVLVVSVAYIWLAFAVRDNLHPSASLHASAKSDEVTYVAPMIDGSLAQILLVALAVVLIPTVREAAKATFKTGNQKAWFIAIMAAGIHVATALAFFVDQPARILEASYLNAAFSFVPALDGWSQEVIFRGYVIIRLAKAGGPAWLQIGMSALLFAAIHVGYIGTVFRARSGRCSEPQC